MTAVNLNRAIRGPVTAVPVVAGKGVRIVPDTVNNRFVVEADETVLWEGTGLFDNPSSVTVSESVENFEYVRFEGYVSEVTNEKVVCFGKPTISGGCSVYYCRHSNGSAFICYTDTLACSSTTISVTSHKHCWFEGPSYHDGTAGIVITKIVGINRISST